MKTIAVLAAALLAAVLVPLDAAAQASVDIGAGAHRTAPDCALARDPGRCTGLQAARAACKDTRGIERRTCLAAQDVRVDCAKARNPQRCEAREQALAACRDKKGPARRQCLRDKGAG